MNEYDQMLLAFVLRDAAGDHILWMLIIKARLANERGDPRPGNELRGMLGSIDNELRGEVEELGTEHPQSGMTLPNLAEYRWAVKAREKEKKH